MKKTWIAVVLVCLLALIPSTVLAESPETAETEEIISSAPTEGLQFEILFQYMPSIKSLQGTNLIIMESKKNNALGIFTTEGQEVIPYGLSNVSKLANGFLSVSKDKDALNGLAIYKEDGTQISDFIYAVVGSNGNWAVGTVVANAADGEKDVKIGKTYYKLVQRDFYYVSDEGVSLVASLGRNQYKTDKFHGDYVTIQDRQDVITAYDRYFQPLDIQLKDTNTAYYQVNNFQIISSITNEVIADGYTAVEESYMPSRMLLLATASSADGSKLQAVLDTNGRVLMPAEYKIITMGDPYVVVANEKEMQGLYSLDEQRLVVPCEFTGIIASDTSADQYINNGYICVEKEGKLGFVDAKTGEVTCAPAYNSRIAKVYGCSLVFDGEDGFVLIAGDGTRTELFDYEEMPASHGDGYLLVAKKNGYYGVIDWHGNEKLPFIHKNVITLTDDSKAMIRTSTGLELDVITAR